MAPVPLNISPALRPWRQAGITHLLLDDEVRERLLARPAPEAAAPGPAAPPACARTETPRPVRPARPGPAVPSGPPATGGGPQAAPSAPAAPAQAPSRATPQGGEVSPAPVQPERPSPRPDVLPPGQWPAYWRDLFQKTPRKPSVLWTYPTLSRDLGGAADDAHRDFLRRLLGDMGLPKGSHAFWPLNRYPYGEGESEATVDARLFLSGVEALGPDSVILMCGEVPPELGLSGLRPLLPCIVHGRRFVVTPHVDVLIRERQRYAQLITFLKALFAGR